MQSRIGDTTYIFDLHTFRRWLDHRAYIHFGLWRLPEYPYPTHRVTGTIAYDALIVVLAGRKHSKYYYHSKGFHLSWWPLKLFISHTVDAPDNETDSYTTAFYPQRHWPFIRVIPNLNQ